jgi:hypothetical protein
MYRKKDNGPGYKRFLIRDEDLTHDQHQDHRQEHQLVSHQKKSF